MWNLSNSTKNRLKNTNASVIVKAGYEDEKGAVPQFYGDISSVVTETENENKITKITAEDGGKASLDKKIAIAFNEGANSKQIVNRIVSEIDLPIKNPEKIDNKTYNSGYSFFGKAKDALREILESINKEYTIQNQEIIIYTEEENVEDTTIEISPKSGLIGTAEKADKERTDKQILVVNVLLLKNFVPGFVFKLDSRDYKGYFKIVNVKAEGDTHGSNMKAELEVEEA